MRSKSQLDPSTIHGILVLDINLLKKNSCTLCCYEILAEYQPDIQCCIMEKLTNSNNHNELNKNVKHESNEAVNKPRQVLSVVGEIKAQQNRTILISLLLNSHVIIPHLHGLFITPICLAYKLKSSSQVTYMFCYHFNCVSLYKHF